MKKDLKFNIDQLRKDKIINAVESASVSLVALVAYFFLLIVYPEYFTSQRVDEVGKPILKFIFLAVVVYWAYTVVGNTSRLRRIMRLEEKLRSLKK